jgi:hypothetical protein
MKKFIKIAFTGFVVLQAILMVSGDFNVSAQEGAFYESTMDPYTPVQDSNFSNTNYSNAGTYFGEVGCVGTGCASASTGGFYESTMDPYTPVLDSNFSNTNYSNAGTYSGVVECTTCGTSNYSLPGVYTPPQTTTYTSPTYETTYTPTVQYTPSVSYTAPSYSTSWTGYNAVNTGFVNTSYVVPSYSNASYAIPSYSNTSYTVPSYSNTTYVNTNTNTTVACPTGTTRVNNACVVNQISCPTGTTLINGACQVNQITCPTGSTLVNGTCRVNQTTCPTGTTLINGTCQANTISCPTGTYLVNGTCQINTTSCPVGSYLVNGSCQITSTSCPPGTYFTNDACVHQVVNQTCWDGSVIPTTSVCPTQYKVCSSGSTVLVTQSCPVIVSPAPVVPAPVVKFNNVVTSIATDITSTSARCRGIGLIANNAQSVGWFEYGETANLGRTTASANIGSANTAPFSNVLTNLKPQTTYYCRAVMQNQYGLVKGEVVSFKTKAKNVVVVKPVVKTITTTKTKNVVKTNEVVCSDGSVISINSSSAATLINSGKKLITLDIDKTYGVFAPESLVTYKVAYKNIADTKLANGSIQITLPAGIIFASSSVGSYDPSTRILTIEKGTIDAYENSVTTFTAYVPKEAIIGSTLAVTAYMSYALPGTKVTDEVTAYVASTVVPSSPQIASQTGSSTERGFMPNSLIEWVALIAILFIIFVLARSIYISYKQKDEAHAPAHH